MDLLKAEMEEGEKEKAAAAEKFVQIVCAAMLVLNYKCIFHLQYV